MRSYELDQVINGYCLNPSIKSDLRKIRSGPWNEFEYKFVDYKLLGAFKVVFPTLNWSPLDDYIDDQKFTKRFSHEVPTFEQLKKFDHDDVRSFTWNKNYIKARKALVQAMTTNFSGHLQPMDVKGPSDLLEIWSKKDASAGAIGRGSKEANIDRIYDTFVQLRKEIAANNSPVIPAVAFHRAQVSKGDVTKQKDRLVWGIDAATNSLEGVYARPLINQLVGNWINYAGGVSPDILRSRVKRFTARGRSWLSTDYSGYDQTVPAWLIKDCFEIIKTFYDSAFHKELDWIRDRFITTHIIFSKNQVFVKTTGIPSGSYFTQVVGSMANFLVYVTYINSIDRMKHVTMDGNISLLVMGDDSLLGYEGGSFNIEDFSAYVKYNFGIMIGTDKSEQGSKRYPKFLKREWRYDQGEYRDIYELVANSIHPENIRDYKGYTPYLIVFGLSCVYNASFSRMDYVILNEKIGPHLNSEDLTRLAMSYDLPGVFQAFRDKSTGYLRREFEKMRNLGLAHRETL